MIPGRFPYKPMIRDLAYESAWVHSGRGVTVDAILSTNRTPAVAEARRYIWRRLKAQGYGVSAIGRLTNRDHSTILHGLRAG